MKKASKKTKILVFVLTIIGVVVVPSLLICSPPSTVTMRNLGSTPLMGWNGWNRFRCNDEVNERLIKETADALVTTGMKEAGYAYIVLDDCWQIERNSWETIVADPKKFPSGMKALGDYIHAKGLKFGIYTSAGVLTCEGRPGSFGHEEKDIDRYTEWGVDFIKVDWCGVDDLDALVQYDLWRGLISKSSRPVVFSIAMPNLGKERPWLWGRAISQMWRVNNDIRDSWESIASIIDVNEPLARYADQNHRNDPDMLVVGVGNLTAEEQKSHLSMWAMMGAPLIAGNDIRTMTDTTREILTNQEAIEIDQDATESQGKQIQKSQDQEVWTKKLAQSGANAVALFNRGNYPSIITVKWSDIGYLAPVLIRDVWEHKWLGFSQKKFSREVPAHGVLLLKVYGLITNKGKTTQLPPLHTTSDGFLSDQEWIYAENGHGPVEKDMSNGETDSGDGSTLSIRGQEFNKGLGVHSYSNILYRLGDKCRLFHAVVGIDDEVEDKKTGAIFRVYGDGQRLYDSGIVTMSFMPLPISVDISGNRNLILQVVSSDPDTTQYQHADWADARVFCNQ
ncbi:NPCBM/NEW2 domain-containing protein [Patescibacteria group bacterium]|nr:NPCBM/NEW2 domain-containing protein [Patescibacteria group bacterium]MBU2459559.1 NPCBM/NEW2 domain-containing protein [Patescibacteria group bacterium]MBU2544200.1 NPCBM/NEW2 domain-containing protein [Patescibacteria group bacterium]